MFPEWIIWPESRRRGLLERFGMRIGLDIDHEYMCGNVEMHHRVTASIDRLPFAERRFDLVTANMVMEHISEPVAALRGIRRILRPGGRFVFHTPNVLYPTMFASHLADSLLPQSLKSALVSRLESRDERDVFPTFYRCNSPVRIRRLSQSAGLTLEELHLVESVPSTMRTFPGLAAGELCFMWLMRKLGLSYARSNLIAVLRHPDVR